MNREAALRGGSSEEERLLLSRIFDLAAWVEGNHAERHTSFLNERELALCGGLLAQCGVSFSPIGGYEGAGRCVIAICPPYSEPGFCPAVVKISGRGLDKLSHRDYLGSLLALGIKRETIGDIVQGEDGCAYVVCLPAIADYILENLTKVGREGVRLSRHTGPVPAAPQRVQEIRAAVASLRADAVVAAGFRLSRSEAAALIESGKVRAGFLELTSPGAKLSEGSVLSVSGMGRARLSEVGGATRKGRIAVTISKYV